MTTVRVSRSRRNNRATNSIRCRSDMCKHAEKQVQTSEETGSATLVIANTDRS